jgi:hypothetical protein
VAKQTPYHLMTAGVTPVIEEAGDVSELMGGEPHTDLTLKGTRNLIAEKMHLRILPAPILTRLRSRWIVSRLEHRTGAPVNSSMASAPRFSMGAARLYRWRRFRTSIAAMQASPDWTQLNCNSAAGQALKPFNFEACNLSPGCVQAIPSTIL